MAIFLTGATGYVGAHVASELLENHGQTLNVLVRAKSDEEAKHRLWKSMQLHLDFDRFHEHLKNRITIFCGDLTGQRFGLDEPRYDALVDATDSVIHCAASLNRKSHKACFNVNLRGTLEMVQLARRIQDKNGLRRYSHVSTVAVAGERQDEVVAEDESVDWARSDYDPYARTKKFTEHMVGNLLSDVQTTIFRPSIVLGDSRHGETTQFDMVQAFVFLASLPILPFRPNDRIDIVPVEYVSEAIAKIHVEPNPKHSIYHLSSGKGSQTFQELTSAISKARNKSGPSFIPPLEKPFQGAVNFFAKFRKSKIGYTATLMKVFVPYLLWNTVFDNSRVVEAMGRMPTKFSEYCYPLYKFSKDNDYKYKYRDWPASAETTPSTEGVGT
ncbi:MAG: NAD(P)H-binding protein [Phycisphaerae bacterium]|nr:MAG: NAD(P)H-binding protein [Phycisphaerae bacterium]